MKAKHTPGTWLHREGSYPHFQGEVYHEETGKTIAVTYSDEGGANGRLIAAAPTLAQRLTDLIQYLGEEWDGDSMIEECKQALADAGVPFEYDDDIIGQP